MAYIAGKRINYYNPLRIFLVVLFAFFTLFLLNIREELAEVKEITLSHKKTAWKAHYTDNYDTLALSHSILRDTTLNLKDKIFKDIKIDSKDFTSIESTDSEFVNGFLEGATGQSFKKGWDSYEPESETSDLEQISELNQPSPETLNTNDSTTTISFTNDGLQMDYLPQFRDFYSMSESQIREKYGKDSRFTCLLYTSPSPRDATLSRMPSSA